MSAPSLSTGALILRRLVQLPFIVLAVYTITFMLAWSVPGNPLENPEGRRPPAEIVEAMKKQYKLDDPVAFYFDYLEKASGIGYLRGTTDRVFDLGPSLKQPDWSVNEILATGLPVSITLGLFPVGGWGGPAFIALPALTLSLPFAAYISRLIRFGMIEEMGADYIRTARAKGLTRARVALHHALKNAFLPVLSYLGPATAVALTGSFVVEKVFAVPGVGQHFVDGVLGKDITLVMGVVLVYSTLMVVFNLVVDVMYRFVDPRIE